MQTRAAAVASMFGRRVVGHGTDRGVPYATAPYAASANTVLSCPNGRLSSILGPPPCQVRYFQGQRVASSIDTPGSDRQEVALHTVSCRGSGRLERNRHRACNPDERV